MAKINSTKLLRLKHLSEKLALAADLLGECSAQAGAVGAGALRGRVMFYAKDLRETSTRIRDLMSRSGSASGPYPEVVEEALVAQWAREPGLRGVVRWT